MNQPIGPGEAARRLGVSTRTVQRWLRAGRLPAVRIGARLKVAPEGFADRAEAEAAAGVRRIRRLLIANRGELVVRIARTCSRLGVTSLALVAADQGDTWWAVQADVRVPLAGSYLDRDAILRAAIEAGADGIHPGYGFLAENADFAEQVVAAGLAWVGPPAAAMRALGDKHSARRLAARLGVPILPGYEGAAQSDRVLAREAERIGFPVLIKPSAGGGGKGMHVVRDAADMRGGLALARREARAAFDDDRLVLERYLDRPRHVEVQLLLDGHGGAVHLGERDCSLQRRHQKVIEESPAPAVDPGLRARLAEAALRLARDAGYVGAGTAEFLLGDDGEPAFLELNARLQVEHPVSEAITGVDLVELQLRVAAGEALGFGQADVRLEGHAVEARIYAEDPWAGFLPATGRVEGLEWPAGDGVRVDAGVGQDDEVTTRYDPLLAKVICWGPDRPTSLARLRDALDATRISGVTTNRGFLRRLLDLPEFEHGDARTDTIDVRWHPADEPVPERAWRAAVRALAGGGTAVDPPLSGFRLNAARRLRVAIGDEERSLPVTPAATADHTEPARAADGPAAVALPDGRVAIDVDGRAFMATLAPPPTVEAAVLHASVGGGAGQRVSAPMPGVVLAVPARAGATVEAHEVLVVLEAMKMENAVGAPADGRIGRVLVRVGQAVQRGDPLVELV